MMVLGTQHQQQRSEQHAAAAQQQHRSTPTHTHILPFCRYAASILELLPKAHFRVQYTTTAHDGDQYHEEVVPMTRVRPRPPVNTLELGASPELMQEHAVIFGNTEIGDHCEMHYLGGWWQVEVLVNPALQPKPVDPSAAGAAAAAAASEPAAASAGPGAIVAEEAGKKKGRPSLTTEQRYDRPPPTAEQLATAKFKVKALKFEVEHADVKVKDLRPIWVWKRKGGNAMTKMGYKRKSKGGGGDEGDGEEGEGEEEEEDDEFKMGDTVEGAWGKSRGREGRNMIAKAKEGRVSMEAGGGGAAPDDGNSNVGHPTHLPWDFAVGDRVEARSMDPDFEGTRTPALILEVDEINRRARVEYDVFFEEDDPTQKMTEWVEYWLIRPCPPKTVQFGLKTAWLRKMPPGAALEVLHEEVWNDCDLIGVFPEGSDDAPPDVGANQFSAGTRRDGIDGKKWYVKERAGIAQWFPVDQPNWKPTKPGDDNVIYRLRLNPSGQIITVNAAEVLNGHSSNRMRPWWQYDRAVHSSVPLGSIHTLEKPVWEWTFSRKDAKKHLAVADVSRNQAAQGEQKLEQMRSYNLALHRYGETSIDLRKLFDVGNRVEVTSFEPGLHGSWFSGQILSFKAFKHQNKTGFKALVRFDDLLDEKNPTKSLEESVYLSQIRPVPPPYADGPFVKGTVRPSPPKAEGEAEDGGAKMDVDAEGSGSGASSSSAEKGAAKVEEEEPEVTTDDFLSAVEIGSTVELRHDDGWWMVTMLGKEEMFEGGSMSYHLRYERTGQDHRAIAKNIRPYWMWRQHDGWMQASTALPKASAEYQQQLTNPPLLEGTPPIPATLFDPLNGTLRLGTDALPYECVLGDMGCPMWMQSTQIIKPKPGQADLFAKPKAGAQLVGSLIDVYWELDKAWYPARVLKFNEKDLKHKVKYIEDQVVEHLNLNEEQWRLAPKLEDEPGPFSDGGVVGASSSSAAAAADGGGSKKEAPPAKGEKSGLKIKIAVDPEWPRQAFGSYADQLEGGGGGAAANAAGSPGKRGRSTPPNLEASMNLLDEVQGAGRKRKRGEAAAAPEEEAAAAAGGASTAEPPAPSAKRGRVEGGEAAAEADGVDGGGAASSAAAMDVEEEEPPSSSSAMVPADGSSSSAIVPVPETSQQQASEGGATVQFAAPDGMEVGTRVEVEMTDEGLKGARYSGVVVVVEPTRAGVRVDAWGEDEEPDWFEWKNMRPHPPSPPGGEGWVSGIRKGDHVDMFYEEAWWEMEVKDIEHERLSRAYIFSLYSVEHGDEHAVADMSGMRPTWQWLSASKQWLAKHSNVKYASTSNAPLSALAAGAGGQADATALLTFSSDMRAGTEVKFKLDGHEAFNLPSTDKEVVFLARLSTDMPMGSRMNINLKLKTPKAEDQLYVTMPPDVSPGNAFRAVLMDGRELLVTAPSDLESGEVMLVTVPSEAVSAAKALKEQGLSGGSGSGSGGSGKLTKKEMREKAQANALERKKRQNVYGIAYKQIEQFIIAKYGTCANGRLMGSLAGAVRAGRMMRDNKLYQPTGSMLSPIMQKELMNMSEAQKAAAIAEEKRNRKLAKQMMLSGKARRRQELENNRLAYNVKVKLAQDVGESRRNAFLKTQLELLAPFLGGAKRSLQAQLGMISQAEAEKGLPGGRRSSAGSRQGGDAPTPPPNEGGSSEVASLMSGEASGDPMRDIASPAGDDSVHAGSSVHAATDAELTSPEAAEAFGSLPESEIDSEQLSNFSWLEATLQPHQVIGLNWMLRAYRYGINGILADEMGLGKTVQTISFLGTLKFECGLHGPSLIVAPLSVLASWVNEFKRFAPTLRVVRLHSGDRDERELMRTELLSDVSNFDVVVTTYEMACSQNMKTVP